MFTYIAVICLVMFCNMALAEEKLRIAATPNPNIFPLLVALAENPSLPVEIVPLANGADIDAAFSDGKADALLAMTYTIADKVTSEKVPDLRLVFVGLWKGFSEVTYSKDHIKQFGDLRGKGLIVSGPAGGGKNGGPDLIFQAALKRSGLNPSDVHLCYLPVMEAVKLIDSHAPLNSNPQCDPSLAMPASGISLVEPATTGLVMQGMMQGLERGISFQPLFTGYTAWPEDQLPHGGLAVLQSVLNDPGKKQAYDQVLAAYKKSAAEISSARAFKAMRIAHEIRSGIGRYFKPYKLELPAPVVRIAMMRGNLLFRSDAPPSIQGDLNRFLTEVVGKAPPGNFYALQPGLP
jgi:hypothetical protein